MAGFVHLHLHSEYSLLDGACRITDIPGRAAECGHTAVALTDHGVMYGAVAFYKACHDAGIKPIIGCEVYVAPGSRFDKQNSADAYHHMVLLCENEVGYRNLIALVSAGFTEGFYVRPRVDRELLRRHHEGLIALSGCLAGKIPKLLLRGQYSEAKAYALECAELFGPEHYYIEIQNHGIEEQKVVLPELIRLAGECHIPLVATNDCHYLRRQDAATQAVLMCIQTGQTMQDGRPAGFETDEFYYKTTDEMRMLFRDQPEALANTERIAERCQFDFDFSTTYLPSFPCPAGYQSVAYLRHLAQNGFETRKSNGELDFDHHPEEEYRKRMAYELDVIEKMGYADYFLIVQDYVNYAKSHGISVGPGRGSGAGSLVAYLLGITDVDSLRFDLLFERFLNPERVSMPDIDIDFCDVRRDEVIRYVADKYGSDHVSQIATFGTLAARAAIRDVGRVMGMSYAEVDEVAKAVPRDLGITLKKALQTPELKELYQSGERVRTLVDTAMALEGMPRNVSVHAAGIVITKQPLSSYVPLAISNSAVITQYDMDTIAKLGLLKFDFLALRYLTIIQETENLIRETDPDFRVERVSLEDAATFKLITQGDTGGIFQLESEGMRSMLMNLRPESLDDIQAAIALYRPGPMESIPQYIEGRHDPSKIRYAIPQLEPILKNTCGCTVYQEQVMSIFREIGGYTFGHADIVRRAMSKKKADVLEAERAQFINGALKNGVSEADATKLFDDMSSFANYAFNKSHAAAYGIISYRTAYLKTHYSREFYAALLTSVLGDIPKLGAYIAECNKRGITVLPPDINESEMNFHVSGDKIRFGLLALKNVGKQFIAGILAERRQGAFLSFEDFVNRMSGSGELNKRQVEALIKCGAFDRLGINRSQLLAVYERILELQADKKRSNLSGQLDMFSMALPGGGQESGGEHFDYPDMPDMSLRDKLMCERESTGMAFSGHLLDNYAKQLETTAVVPLLDIITSAEQEESRTQEDVTLGTGGFSDRQVVRVAGIVNSVTHKTTKKEEPMAFFTLEDRYAQIECIAFPQKYEAFGNLLRMDAALYVEGALQFRENESPKLLVNVIKPLVENSAYQGQVLTGAGGGEAIPVKKAGNKEMTGTVRQPTQSVSVGQVSILNAGKLYLRVPDMEGTVWRKVANLLDIFDGFLPVVIYDASRGKYLNSSRGMGRSAVCLAELVALLGAENVILK